LSKWFEKACNKPVKASYNGIGERARHENLTLASRALVMGRNGKVSVESLVVTRHNFTMSFRNATN